MAIPVNTLLLVLVANGAPVLAQKIFGSRFAQPLDLGRELRDGHRLFGDSKTFRGILGAIVASACLAPLLNLPLLAGILVGAGAMLGDLLSSFCKRRLGLPSGSMAPGLDQVPESLVPALLVAPLLNYSITDIVIIVFSFILLELLLSQLFYRLGIRKNPY